MILITAICVAVIFGVSIYMMLGRDLKGVAMGVFLLSHAANLSILSMSGSPVRNDPEMGLVFKQPPLLTDTAHDPAHAGEHAAAKPALLETMVDPLPQALILTAIVISFAVMGFLLALIVVTGRRTRTLNVDNLAREQLPTPSATH
ncbi:MAG: Na(+)/H(+) antiporter subunit C [Planctomycetes bacterium]|jgi:multicomponent Na+:H+ antiporter subunit C|nr:Na(+)/H(+) antiporter subunit C [Planctomycetota bacterium]